MEYAIKEYDAKLDTKKRVTLRGRLFEYYHVTEYEDGRIVMEPRVLVSPLQVSPDSLVGMEEAVQNMKEGKVTEAIDLTEFA